MKRIRVMIVEDSPVVREHLRRIIAADPRLEVAHAASTAEEALDVLDRVAPDVISMDVLLPGMQGIEATRRVMAERPTPIVIVSGIDTEQTDLTMEALKAGALSVVEKPVAASHADYAALASRLCTQLVIMSEVKVVRRRPAAWPERTIAPMRSPAAPYQVLGVAASTGGPGALMNLLTALRADFPLPIVIVQHMTPSFIDGFASWLSRVSKVPVDVVENRTVLQAGTAYLAPASRHLNADARTAWPEGGELVSGHCPSADVLFSSMARSVGPAGIGVLLTGMGEDGAQGLKCLRANGGHTIAEDESTAVIYGMPGAAERIGAACELLPLGQIAPRVRQLVYASRRVA